MTTVVRNTIRVLRSVIAFRLIWIAMGVVALLLQAIPIQFPKQPSSPMHHSLLLPALISSLFLLIPWLEKRLGRFYLPAALVLTILDLSLQYGIAYMRPGHFEYVMVTINGREVSFFWASTEIILLVLLPCILAGAAYGLRSAVWASSLATVLHLGIGLAIWKKGLPLEGYFFLLPVRIGVLFAFPMIVGKMTDSWRQEHADLESANQQLRGYAATIENLATSRERVRVARAMHDTLAHTLSALTVQLEALDALQETNPEAARAQLTKLRDHSRVGLDEARKAIFDLRSAPVEEFGLPHALEQLVERFAQRNGLQATWTLNGEPFALIPAQANALYRIVEEALENVERHAVASQIAVQLDYDTGVVVRVSDDGRGFDPDQVDAGRFGLLGIHERCALIEATASLDSAPGQGTVLTVHVAEPWKE